MEFKGLKAIILRNKNRVLFIVYASSEDCNKSQALAVTLTLQGEKVG